MQQTVLHLEGFSSRHDLRLVRSKLSPICGVRHIRCVPATHSIIVTHDPVQASVELILWAVRDTGRQATVLHHTTDPHRWPWPATATVTLAGLVVLCHWRGVPPWLEMAVLLAAVASAVWSFWPLWNVPPLAGETNK